MLLNPNLSPEIQEARVKCHQELTLNFGTDFADSYIKIMDTLLSHNSIDAMLLICLAGNNIGNTMLPMFEKDSVPVDFKNLLHYLNENAVQLSTFKLNREQKQSKVIS
jgi:hypothetical protein